MNTIEGKGKFVLVDAPNMFYRAYHVSKNQRPLYTPAQELVTTVYGFASMLLKMIERERPTYLALAWEGGGETFRHKLCPEYKTQRPTMPKELRDQLPRIRQVAAALGVPIYQLPEWEADDVIASLVKQAQRNINVGEVVIVSGDCDLLQLAYTPRADRPAIIPPVKLAMPGGKGEDVRYMNATNVLSKYDVGPLLFPDYKALVGDSSDNYKGVAGIGPVNAARLLNHYGALDDMLTAAMVGRLEPAKTRKMLLDNSELIDRNLKLARLVSNLDEVSDDIKLDLEFCRFGKADHKPAYDLFRELYFHNLYNRLDTAFRPRQPRTTQNPETNPEVHSLPMARTQRSAPKPKLRDDGQWVMF